MGRRSCDRFPVTIGVKFFFGSTLCSGAVKNISKRGMYIKADVCLPFGSNIDLMICLKEGSLSVPVRICRLGNTYNAFGVQVDSPSREYLSLVERIKGTLRVAQRSG